MKTDYLWDKTGDDAEIEQLEKALASFRYRDDAANFAPIVSHLQTTAPDARAEKFSFGREFGRRLFSIRFAAAACAALTLIAFGVWQQTASDKTSGARESASVIAPVKDDALEINSGITGSTDSRPANVEDGAKAEERRIVERKPVARGQYLAASFARRKAVSPVKKSAAKIQFTDEERYAYDQLKLALSFTSSTLKLVRDKAESAEEPDAGGERENGR